MSSKEWAEQHATELQQRVQEEEGLLEDLRKEAQADLKRFLAAQAEEVELNEKTQKQRQNQLEEQIAALEGREENLDWKQVKTIVGRIVASMSLDMESPEAPRSSGGDDGSSSKKNMERLLELAASTVTPVSPPTAVVTTARSVSVPENAELIL
eukprot:Protomagalhaensia_sp_Gyna_25__5893@NODE_893_length_2450_cov_488_362920_g183_i1_p4_GENE_NODE_893_length_2450_cov_488_362920_g183_i1NODE_893_length_2450_cov_488_362920_g183_i1_p4_ORF_typecomplete_len154_score36_98Clathrin_lg_ch/PF01086_17/6_8e08HAUS6_N/PF14661_6/0_043SKA1/PF07160_12/0_053DUF1640/PF07798_11/0_069Exonuc_VII_L/PF02601_15/0_099Coagulase/PF08764_10/0_23Phage_HK97_TLTM/PF06120_11/0_33Atg14/PF10186_9/0_77Caps_synth_GfcC/PF06251_11/1_7DUF3584/PF12128_8/1_2AAA_23/PF13476_6/1_4DUF2937/PF111